MRRADTFFLATGYEGPLPNGDGHAGLDISHRGGPPGFVRVDGPGTLKWADYLGNLTFTTLGKTLAYYPPAGYHAHAETNASQTGYELGTM
jgi:predicted pyridoxine 5'-phosphate oxidase superfamily flavin-nucleotide-binding protein